MSADYRKLGPAAIKADRARAVEIEHELSKVRALGCWTHAHARRAERRRLA
jgi:hypothetical protein